MIELTNESNIEREVVGTFSQSNYEEYRKTGDKNYWEEVVERKVISDYIGDDKEANHITLLPSKDKRKAIISLLDDDHGMWSDIIKLMDGDIEFNGEDHSLRLVKMLRDYVKVAKVNKKKFGEIMTPFELIRDMLSTLPKEVWKNPGLKWLDPSNGVGPFPVMVIWKLMRELKDWEPDGEKRYKHIVENMIYVCELQYNNMMSYMCAVDPQDKYPLNIYWGSFLEDGFNYHMKEVWEVEKFDIILGNPPYNDGQKQGKNSSLWTKFIITSDELLKNSGFLLFVTPSSWIAPSEIQKIKLKKVFFNNNLIHLNLKCGKYFDVGSTFSFYLIKKSNDYTTTIINNDFSIKLTGKFLPNILSKESLSIMNKFFFSDKKKLSFSSGLRNDDLNDDNIGEYKVWYGSKLRSSESLGKNYHIKKIIVNKPGYLKARFDNGLYNTSANNYWVEVNEKQANNLLSFFETKFSKLFLDNLCKYSGYNSLGVLKSLPILLLDNIWTDKMLYKHFNLTEEEIKLIENS